MGRLINLLVPGQPSSAGALSRTAPRGRMIHRMAARHAGPLKSGHAPSPMIDGPPSKSKLANGCSATMLITQRLPYADNRH